MPVGAFVPSRIHLDYPEWQAPLIGNVGQVWAYDGTGYVPTSFLLSSAVSVYGLTLASAADAAAARTTLELGTAATLNVGTGANQIVQLDGSSRLPAVDGSQLTGITVAAAGSNTQVIINDGGVYAGDAGLTYNASTDRLTVVGGIIAGDWSPPSDSSTAVSIWNAARSTRVLRLDTTNNRLILSAAAPRISIETSATNQQAEIIAVNTASKYVAYTIYSTLRAGSIMGISYNNLAVLETSASSTIIHAIGSTQNISFGINNTERARFGSSAIIKGLFIGGGVDPTAVVDVTASDINRASLRIRVGTAPTSPNAGDIWYPTGGRLNVYRAATETIASGVPGTGGSATATGTWGATEQAMLQAVYDIARSFGMLS